MTSQKAPNPTAIRLYPADKKALEVIKRLFSRPGEKIMSTTDAIRVAIHDTASKAKKNEPTQG